MFFQKCIVYWLNQFICPKIWGNFFFFNLDIYLQGDKRNKQSRPYITKTIDIVEVSLFISSITSLLKGWINNGKICKIDLSNIFFLEKKKKWPSIKNGWKEKRIQLFYVEEIIIRIKKKVARINFFYDLEKFYIQ